MTRIRLVIESYREEKKIATVQQKYASRLLIFDTEFEKREISDTCKLAMYEES